MGKSMASARMRELVHEAWKEAGGVEPVLVDREVERATHLLEPLLGDGVELETAFAGRGARVCATRGHLEQLLAQLAIHARAAMPDGGRVCVETAVRTLDDHDAQRELGRPGGRWVALVLGHGGRGMDPRTLARLAEPLFPHKRPRRDEELGLWVVYHLVRRLGGHVEANSEPGEGSSFRIHLPAVQPSSSEGSRSRGSARRSSASTPTRAAPTGRSTVLVVESRSSSREAIVELLQEQGHHVLAARDARQALWMSLHHDGIHIAVCAVDLPDLPGTTLADDLAESRPELAVLFMSVMSLQEDPALAVASRRPRRAVLCKPVELEHMLAEIERLLHAQRPDEGVERPTDQPPRSEK